VFVPNGGWYPEIKTYQNDQFVSAYLAKYGGKTIDINSGTAQGYAVGQVLEQAVNKTHSIDNAKLIQEMHQDAFDSVQGPVKFSAKGENTVSVAYLFQWQNGQPLVVYPTNKAQENPEYPKKNWP
jgi:branched-chain amino acid transport system substrate-binding protein